MLISTNNDSLINDNGYSTKQPTDNVNVVNLTNTRCFSVKW